MQPTAPSDCSHQDDKGDPSSTRLLSAAAVAGPRLLQAASVVLMATVLPHAVLAHASNNFDVADELAHYGAYHQHPYNQAIHFLFVPLLIWTEMILFAHAPLCASMNITIVPGIPPHACNHATFWWVALTLMALLVEPLGGTLYAPVLYLMYRSSIRLHLHAQQQQQQSSASLIQWAIVGNVISWLVQVGVGHAWFEGNRPALLDSFAQSLSIAPLFAFYEGLFLVGINTELQQQTLRRVAALTKELCDNGTWTTVPVCATY